MIITNELDTLFYQASLGDEQALKMLLNKFLIIGNNVVYKNGPIVTKNYASFRETIYECFMICLKSYNLSDSKFITYSKLVLERYINLLVQDIKKEIALGVISLDDCLDGERPLIETIEDKTVVAIPDAYSVDQFKLRMSSPLYKNNKNVNLRAKINQLLVLGYKREEICKILKISVGILRYNIRLNKQDKELANLKLELK